MIPALALLVATSTTAPLKPETVREAEFYFRAERALLAGESCKIDLEECHTLVAGCRARKRKVERIVVEAPPPECMGPTPPLVEALADPVPRPAPSNISWGPPILGAGIGGGVGALSGSLASENRLAPTLCAIGGGIAGALIGFLLGD